MEQLRIIECENKKLYNKEGPMRNVTFHYKHTCRLTQDHFRMLDTHTRRAVQEARSEYEQQYNTPYGFAYVPEDTAYHDTIRSLAQAQRDKHPAAVCVIGIGGSSLGTEAVEAAIRGLFSHTCTNDIAFYCADTIDTDRSYQLCQIVKQFLENGRDICLNIVSKSGTTTETLINASIFIDILRHYRPDTYRDWIVITTDAGSPLETYAKEHTISYLNIPSQIEGRYSVFTAVGIFPLHLLGVDTHALLEGARQATHTCLQEPEDPDSNPAITSATIVYQHYAHGRNIHDTFLFDAGLRGLGDWYRQLMGESIGKKKGKNSQTVRVGITPTVSIGTLDLHSVAQLYLAGPRDKLTTFVYIENHPHDVTIPDVGLTHKLPLKGKNVESVKSAIFTGVQRSYMQEERPFVSVCLDNKSEHAIGECMQFKMFEIAYLAHLLHVNAFDQPQVEIYKEETRKVLQDQEKEQS